MIINDYLSIDHIHITFKLIIIRYKYIFTIITLFFIFQMIRTYII